MSYKTLKKRNPELKLGTFWDTAFYKELHSPNKKVLY